MSTEVLSTTTTIAKSEKQIQKQLKEKEKKQKKKERKKQQKIEKQIKQESSDNEDTKDFESNSEQQPQIEIEYVNEDLNSELDPSLLGEYQDIFSKFQTKEAPSETEDAEKVRKIFFFWFCLKMKRLMNLDNGLLIINYYYIDFNFVNY